MTWKCTTQISKRTDSEEHSWLTVSCHPLWIHHCICAKAINPWSCSQPVAEHSEDTKLILSCLMQNSFNGQLWLGEFISVDETFLELHCSLKLFPPHISFLPSFYRGQTSTVVCRLSLPIPEPVSSFTDILSSQCIAYLIPSWHLLLWGWKLT